MKREQLMKCPEYCDAASGLQTTLFLCVLCVLCGLSAFARKNKYNLAEAQSPQRYLG
jgi:hypothetical protein